MSWTYSGNPSSSSLDEVRFLLGDIDQDFQLLQDEEIDYLLTDRTPRGAAAEAAAALAARFAREVSFSADGVSVQVEQLQDKYERLAVTLRYDDRRSRQLGIPYAGGYSKRDVMMDEADGDRIPLHWATGMNDNPAAGAEHVQTDGGSRPENAYGPES